ncbi:MAG: hypothetical protein BWK73_24635 [Thiothrix lacustris]|uniref:AAA+ ATPase domain-containing protein n=1 Tax=Thiothrix lacustris TaxID=525917 RepID=A0A1Y1QLQ4_9GAMM|nr:MAG: hypothetical protein BWK73_24635 [Thiothrix lacustris]
MLGTNITFTGIKGVGTVALELQPDQRVYTLIGVNGVGKTKTLEALFQLLLSTHREFRKFQKYPEKKGIALVFQSAQIGGQIVFDGDRTSTIAEWRDTLSLYSKADQIDTPMVFLASQNRGFIQHKDKSKTSIGSVTQRREQYFTDLISGMNNSFTSLNMDTAIEEWFVTLAQSANPYQKQEDNREVEIKTVLKLLHDIDERIDPQFMEISGDSRVSLKIEGEKRELSHLSTGFASILKIIQAIVSGYGYFTNETQLQNVKGIVLIDEIESHLHLSWQAHIIPLLKRLFPNTTFYITTHSSIVLSQLQEGEAYRLERDEQGVVRTHLIKAPNKAAMVDVLKDAFGIDLNQMKLERMSAEQQQTAKQRLLSLINQ